MKEEMWYFLSPESNWKTRSEKDSTAVPEERDAAYSGKYSASFGAKTTLLSVL